MGNKTWFMKCLDSDLQALISREHVFILKNKFYHLTALVSHISVYNACRCMDISLVLYSHAVGSVKQTYWYWILEFLCTSVKNGPILP